MSETRKCMTCGAELGPQESYCGSCGTKAPGGAEIKEDVELTHLSKGTPTSRDFGMKWHWWVTRVILMLSAVSGIGWGLIYFSGRGAELYGRGLSIFMGIVEIAIAVFAIVVRKKLVDFRYGGPVYLYLYLICRMLAPIIILLFSGLMSYVSFGDIVGELIPNIIFLALNVVYYSKRMSLFEY